MCMGDCLAAVHRRARLDAALHPSVLHRAAPGLAVLLTQPARRCTGQGLQQCVRLGWSRSH